MVDRSPVWDVVVAGAGIAGAATALGLKRAAGTAVRVALADPALAGSAARSFRAVAVAADTRRFLTAIGAWGAVADAAQPIRSMVVTDARPGLLPHPELLTFSEEPSGPIAHMVLADDLRAALLDACAAAGVALLPAAALSWRDEPSSLAVRLTEGPDLRTRLLVAADGGRSRLRHAARIQTVDHAYDQAAVVATLRHPEDHEGRAVQHFFPAGPLALLPLRAPDGTGRRTSLVWTVAKAEADRLVALAPETFATALQAAVGVGLGLFTLEDGPSRHGLRLMVAKRLAARRVALVGDAARIIHPLAGQGLNLGLRDAAALTRHGGGQVSAGLDPGAADTLAAYEAERRIDTVGMATATHLLNRVFAMDALPVRLLRDIGLGLVDRSPRLKRGFACGAGSAAPPDHASSLSSGSVSLAAPAASDSVSDKMDRRTL